jgi:ribosomal protein L11 methyltransferase
MFSVTVTCPEAEQDSLIALLWQLGTCGVTQETNWIRAFFDEKVAAPEFVTLQLQAFDAHLDAPEPQYDWAEHWKESWQPFLVGGRFYLSPPWLGGEAPGGRLRLNLRPGMACGSGLHPCTRLCLSLMESEVRPGRALLDVGTGSGILAEAAYLLGARPVIACDIVPEAALIAHHNLTGSNLPADCFAGSVRSIRTQSVPCAVANLNAVTLQGIGQELKRVCSDVLVVSGFRDDELSDVAKAIGIPLKREAELDGWGAAVLRVSAL